MKDMSNSSLYGAIAELKKIEEIMDNENIEERKNELTQIILSKTDSIVYYNQHQEDFLEALNKRIEELQELKEATKNKMDRFDSYVISCLKTLGVEKLSGRLMSISIRKPRKKVHIYDEKLIDPRFIKTKIETSIDLVAITNAIKSNENVDGASLIDGKESLNYKAGK
jgi:hypothetical protein